MAGAPIQRSCAMIAGHFGFAALIKAREREVPLWALMLATVWLDVVFVPLYIAGIESIETVPGTQGGYGTGVINADYTHSPLGALLLAGVSDASREFLGAAAAASCWAQSYSRTGCWIWSCTVVTCQFCQETSAIFRS
jgi:hypothetical protein